MFNALLSASMMSASLILISIMSSAFRVYSTLAKRT